MHDDGLTRDTPAPGVVVWQPARGYRYGVEVYALAHFARGDARTALDLGCGSGVIGLLLASVGVRVRAVDRDPRWVALARRNAEESGLPLEVEHGDVREVGGPRVDVVVTNPPWFPPQTISPDDWKAGSRAMLNGTVADFVAAGLRLASRVCVVTRAERELGPVWVARRARLGERIVLVEVREGEGETVEEPLDLAAAYASFGR